MYFLEKRKSLIAIVTVLLFLNFFLGILYIKQKDICDDFSMSSASWASIAGNYKAELDYIKGIPLESLQNTEAYDEDLDKAAWKAYSNSYNRKYKKLLDSKDDFIPRNSQTD